MPGHTSGFVADDNIDLYDYRMVVVEAVDCNQSHSSQALLQDKST